MSDCWMYPPPFHEASGRGGEAVSTAEGGVSGAIYNGAVCSMGLVEEFCDEPCGEDGCEYVGDFLDTSLVLPPSAASSSSSSLITVSAGGRTMPILLAGPTDCLAVRALSLSLRRTGYTTAQPLVRLSGTGPLTRTLAARALPTLDTSLKSVRAESRLDNADGASAIEGHFVAIEPRTICRTISG